MPPKGLIAARELISREKVAAIFGGIDTPVAHGDGADPQQGEDAIHMGVWAAGTGITRNGANPNYIFRVSAVDVLVDVKLLDYANKKFGAKKAGLMLINNPWGESNEKGLVAAARPTRHRDRRHREIRERRRRHGAAAHAPEGKGRRRHHPGRQRARPARR